MPFNSSSRANAFLRPFTAVQFALCALLSLTGCHSHPPAQKPETSELLIHGNTPGQIRKVTEQVFIEKGYESMRNKTSSLMVFEKKGTKWENLAYGDWSGSVWIRVDVSLEPAGEEAFRLEYKARLLEDRGETTEEEIRMAHLKSRPFQEILDEIGKRLGQK
jgi:hypothetical protein